jgi:hypothetical protein
VNEGLITGKEAVAAGQKIALQPPLAGMLAQDLHHSTVRREMIICPEAFGFSSAIGDVE